MREPIRCVLFDLDGTLADTAPDLAAAINRTRDEDGLAPVPLERLRPVTSQGVRGLLRVSYGIAQDDARYAELFERVLHHYAANICVETRLFDGMADLLAALERRDVLWGVVTNKRTRFTKPLMAALGLTARAASIVSGDTTANPKPAPDPLFHAARECGIEPARCLYLGDDERDIVAASAAGMRSVAVRWGYLGEDRPLEEWGADHIIEIPEALLDYIDADA